MTEILIGSTAAKAHFNDWRDPKDLDFFADHDIPGADVFWHEGLREYFGDAETIATPSELYTIKVSHAYWDLRNGSWTKHMHDAVELKARGAGLDLYLHDLLYKVWEVRHGKKVVNLTQDKEAFFSDAVPRVYDHDSIHYSVAYGDQPIYERVMKDGASVQTDMAKVKALPFFEQIALFREEIYATALERWVIPSDYKVSPGLAYTRAVKKTITSLTKGWSARFLAENYDLIRLPDMDYVGHHLSRKDQLILL